MLRHFYAVSDLAQVVAVEKELIEQGIAKEQMHVLTNDDQHAEELRVNEVDSFQKQDLLYSSLLGTGIGLVAGGAILLLTFQFEWYLSPAGWLPFVFLACSIAGFIIWEGGLLGLQRPNHHFTKFRKLVDHGKHILFVDTDAKQEKVLRQVIANHPLIHFVGLGNGAAKWARGIV